MIRNESVDVPTRRRDFPDQARTDKRMTGGGHQADDLDLRREVGVHVGEFELVLEVRDGPQPAHNTPRPPGAGVLYGEAGEAVNGDVRQVGDRLPRQVEALDGGEERARFLRLA